MHDIGHKDEMPGSSGWIGSLYLVFDVFLKKTLLIEGILNMFKACPSCGQELAWRDNDNPLLNCVELCENAKCKNPHRVEYYEAPADVSLFRATELWEECLVEAAASLLGGIAESLEEDDVRVLSVDLAKHADALYLKRSRA